MLAIADQDVTQRNLEDLLERLAHLERLPRRYHLQLGGLCCRIPNR